VASAVPHDLLTPREVAEVMRVSTMTVYRLIKAGDLRAIRVGKHLRIRGQDVAEFLDARVVRTPAATRASATAAKHRASETKPAEGKPWPAA
jgi:excisionase family DNA binding protein